MVPAKTVKEREMALRRALILALTFLMMASAVATIRAAQEPQTSMDVPLILSDMHGYDFGAYMNVLTNRIRAKWYEAMPDTARQGQKGRVVLIFTVLRNGAIQNLRIVASSGTQSLDEAATNAVQSASPFSALPEEFRDNHIDLQLAFRYNQR
jgi:TonB family protein